MRDFYIEWIAKNWKNINKKMKAIAMLFIIILFIGARFIIYSNNNLNAVYIHIIDIPIILAGIIFGLKGGILGGLVGGIILTPFSLFELQEVGFRSLNNITNWLTRSGFLVIKGIVVGVSFDLLNKKMEELEKASFFNLETGLANKNKLIHDIDEIILPQTEKNYYLILINIDNYSEIINTIGHRLSSNFFQKISKEIQKRLESNINIYNIYGNKFSILIKKSNKKSIAVFVDKLIKILEDPFTFNKIPIYLNTYLGIVQISEKNQYEETILQDAYIAMNKARENKNKYLYSNSNLNQNKNTSNLILLSEIKSAIKKNNFSLYYQPKLNLRTGKIVGAEALIRWDHYEKGIISPSNFIPQAEKTALINNLTYWVIQKAAEDIIKFQKDNIDLNIAINIVPRNLKDKEFPRKIENIINDKNIESGKIELELTETDIMEELEEAELILAILSDKGFKISLDDFGTGYSSLSYLKNLPINNIKIDRSFVRDILVDNKDRQIVKAAVELGHILNKKVIAEGVETRKGLELIKNMKCDFVQGYFIGRPLPYEEFKKTYITYCPANG